MAPRYRAALALTLALAASIAAGAAVPKHRHTASRKAPATAAPLPADEIYSRRALRKARIILELKLMELRAERLERIRKALEKRVPIDKLLNSAH